MKKVVITGAGKGIGAALATKFASEGHEVAVCARTGKDLDTLAQGLIWPVLLFIL